MGAVIFVRRADAVLISAVVRGELLFGFRNGTRYDENRAQLNAFLSRRFVQTIEVTLESAERFGLIAAQLRHTLEPLHLRTGFEVKSGFG
jgi:tRNA(fMet)-specific endonuclease VapC